MDNIYQQILSISNTRLRGIDLSLDYTCHEVIMLWMTSARHWFIMRTRHVIDQSPFSMLYIYNTCSTYYQSIHWSYMAHSDLGKMDVRANFVDISRLKIHQPKQRCSPVSSKQSKSTTNNLSKTWWGPSIIMSTDDTMYDGMTVLRWFLTVQ